MPPEGRLHTTPTTDQRMGKQLVLYFPLSADTFRENTENRASTMKKQDRAKRAAGEQAASLVQHGMRIGLGTGSTVRYALEALGRRVREEGLSFAGVPTSLATEEIARRLALPLVTLAEAGRLDMAIDGADEIDPHWRLIKGGGGAHTREKIIAGASRPFCSACGRIQGCTSVRRCVSGARGSGAACGASRHGGIAMPRGLSRIAYRPTRSACLHGSGVSHPRRIFRGRRRRS